MPGTFLLRRFFLLSSPSTSAGDGPRIFTSFCRRLTSYSEEQTGREDTSTSGKIKGKWLTLPPFDGTADGTTLGREVCQGGVAELPTIPTTALKWVTRCCPELPRSLIQKLFRLRQVRRDSSTMGQSDCRLKRIAAKDSINLGDRVYLPITVKELHPKKKENGCHLNMEEVNFVRSLELYKDSSIIAINKPPGMPVQGGIGIKRSLDELAATCLKYDFSEPPRLVHRLDRECSGILVMGRTRMSATFLHTLYREKTIGASDNDIQRRKRILQRRYWALVMGVPSRSKGLISAPLGKVVVDNGKSDRITVISNAQSQSISSQHAITEYQVIDSHHGYTWLELSPLTGRKHQLRVHCAEVLGTPIVGDYKYGWQAHRNWRHFPSTCSEENENEKIRGNVLPFDIDLDSGSLCDKRPRLHLHCKQIHLPDLSLALENQQSSRYDLSKLESLDLVAPLPPYMRRSLDILNSSLPEVS